MAVLALIASACGNPELADVLDDPPADSAASGLSTSDTAGDQGDSAEQAETAFDDAELESTEADSAEDAGSVFAENADCGQRPFVDLYRAGDRWCWDRQAFGQVEVLGGDGIGYRAERGEWSPYRAVAVTGEFELAHLIDAGLGLDAARNICSQMVQSGAATAEKCGLRPNPGSLALAAVQGLLEGQAIGELGSPEAIEALTAIVTPNEDHQATFNRHLSYSLGASADGCWLFGDVTLSCGIDIRDDDARVIDTITVNVFPEGVTGPNFEGFTGEWTIDAASDVIETEPPEWKLSIYGLSGIDEGSDLRTVAARFGGQVDVTSEAPVQGECFRAAGEGFPGLQFLVAGADSGDPLDGIVQGYVSLSPDYRTPSGVGPGAMRAEVTDALGLQLERTQGSGLAGYWLDFRAEDPEEQDVTVRFEVNIIDRISMVAAGARDFVTNRECGHIE